MASDPLKSAASTGVPLTVCSETTPIERHKEMLTEHQTNPISPYTTATLSNTRQNMNRILLDILFEYYSISNLKYLLSICYIATESMNSS
jgi:hypothetical protein